MVTILIYHLILLTQLFIVCRNKTVNIKELLQTFIVGATMAVFGNFIVQGIFAQILGSDVVVYTAGPISEEIFKVVFIAFVLLKTKMGKTTTIQDSALLGAAAGAGFGFAEDTVRALGHGLSFMQQFPGYNFSAIPTLLTSWLPSERSFTSIADGRFVGGHLLWTAMSGIGIGYALRFKDKKWKFLIPIVLLVWVTLDHSLANNPDSSIGFLYPMYGYGMGLRYGFTLLLLAAIILDELLINKNLPKDEKLLIPGEKKRSLFGELYFTILNIRFGGKHVRNLVSFFSLRRQLAVAVFSQEKTDELKDLLSKQRLALIASARFGNVYQEVSPDIIRFWSSASSRFGSLKPLEKLWIVVFLISTASTLFVAWLFLFSLYFPFGITKAIVSSPLFAAFGILGYGITALSFIEYYRKKQWKVLPTYANRLAPIANTFLVHSGVLTTLIYLPGFFGGRHPLLKSAFFWDQFRKYWEALEEMQKWIGGTVSAGINFIPIVGNVKSAFEAATGYDYIAGKKVEGMDRALAVIGAIPLYGNIARGGRYALQIGKVIKAAEKVDKIAGYVNFGRASRDDLVHAYDALEKELGALSPDAARDFAKSRTQALNDMQRYGSVSSQSPGVYTARRVDVFTGKEGLHVLGVKVEAGKLGHVSVDHGRKSVLFDTITEDHGQASGDFDGAVKSLQEKYQGYDVVQMKAFDSGFTQYNVVSPNGAKSQFYSVPTFSSHQVPMVGSR